jgi:hypothetical protein
MLMSQMIQLIKSIGIVLAISLGLTALVGAVILGGVAISIRVSNKCTYEEIDRLPSPTGRLTVDRTLRSCSLDEAPSPILFSLLPPGAPFDENKTFFKTSDYPDSIANSFGVVAKWIDDNNLLIADPAGARLETAPSEFDGIHIQYGVYPLDAGTTRNDSHKKVIEKKVIFEPSFAVNDRADVKGVGCLLTANAAGGEYLDELSLYLSARRWIGVTGFDANKGTMVNGVLSTFDFQISARDETVRPPDKYATGAEVVGFAPEAGKIGYLIVRPPGEKQPNRKPKWAFGYTPANPHDVIAVAEELRKGSLTIRVGYWLDDIVVVYAMAHPVDALPIDEFEQCIADHHLFDTPLHGADQEPPRN